MTIRRDLAWALGGGLLVTVLVPLVLINPPAVAVLLAVLGALAWVVKQGIWRVSYVLVIVTTLGAISSVEAWAALASPGRLVAVAILLVVTYQTTREHERKPLWGLNKWIFGFLVVIVIIAGGSAVWSVSIVDTLTQVPLLVAMVAIIYRLVTRRWVSRETMVGDFRAAYIVLSVLNAVGIVADNLGLVPRPYSERFQGMFNNPNLAALIAVLTFFIGLGLLLEKFTLMRALLLVPPVMTLALTETRAAFLAVGAALVYIAFRAGPKVFFPLALAIAAVAAFGQPLWGPIVARFGVVSAGDAFAGRTLGWETAASLLEDRPVGYGWATTQPVFADAYRTGRSHFEPESIHNSYMQLYFELNVVGAIILGLLLAGVVTLIMFRQKPVGVEVGLAGAVAAGFIMQLSESALFGIGQTYPWLYWFAVAGLMSQLRPFRSRAERLQTRHGSNAWRGLSSRRNVRGQSPAVKRLRERSSASRTPQ